MTVTAGAMNPEQERQLIIALIEDLIQREIVWRVQSDEGPYLVFPSIVSHDEYPTLPEESEGKAAIFTFDTRLEETTGFTSAFHTLPDSMTSMFMPA